jgi:hypothetical protein
MPRPVQIVKDMEIDEISLVDRAACPPAAIVIAKRADPEVGMDEEFYDENGNPIDLNDFDEGDVIEDEDGNQYQIVFEDDGDEGDGDEDDVDYVEDEDGELVAVGKSAFGFDPIVAGIRSELAKAVNEDDRDAVLSKAFTTLSKRAAYAESQLAHAEEIAKGERDLRLQREYIAKAAEYNVPIDPEELGPVIMRMAESMSYDDCAVIHKALAAAGEMLYTEAGFDSSGIPDDPISQIDAFLDEQVSKSDGGLSKAGAISAFFDSNPEAYDAYRTERNR